MTRPGKLPNSSPLITVAVASLSVMTLFEAVKQLLNADISIWESHLLTIAFTSALSVAAAAFALKQIRRYQKVLLGLLRICASCKRVRNERGEWIPMEEYLHLHSEVDFSHGICPECAKHFRDAPGT